MQPAVDPPSLFAFRTRCCAAIAALVLLGATPLAALATPALNYAATDTIQVGQLPIGVAVDPTTHSVFVANNDGNISVIDGDSDKIVKTITTFNSAYGLAVDPLTHLVYTTIFLGRTAVAINGLSRTVFGQVTVGLAPAGVGIDTSSKTVYVANQFPSTNSVSVIAEGASDEATQIPVGYRPTGVGVDSTTHTIFVSQNDSTVAVIDGGGNTLTTTINTYPDGNGAGDVAVDETTHTVYVAHPGNSAVSVIDGLSHKVTKTIPISDTAFTYGIAVDPTVHVVYVANQYPSGAGTVTIIDGETNSIYTTVNVGSGPYGVAVDPSTHTAYVTNSLSNTVSVITSPIPPGPGTLAFTHTSYDVVEGGNATITVQRFGATNFDTFVDYKTANKKAHAGVDYTATNGTLHFAPGDKSKSFTVATLDDGKTGGKKSKALKLALSNPIGGSLRNPFKAELVIEKQVAPQFSAAIPPATAKLHQAYKYRFEATGSPGITFSIASGALPHGVHLDPATGRVKGKPKAGGTFDFSVKASNGVDPDAVIGPFSIEVQTPPEITADDPPTTATVGTFYFYKFEAAADPMPAFALASGTLPDGIQLFDTGSFGGTPTKAGQFTFTLKATNGVKPDAVTPEITITVSNPPS